MLETFYVSDATKGIFERISKEIPDYRCQLLIEIEASRILLKPFGVKSYDLAGILKDNKIRVNGGSSIPSEEILPSIDEEFHQVLGNLTYLTFHYPELRSKFKVPDETFNDYYFALLAFNLTYILGIQSVYNFMAFGSSDYMNLDAAGVEVLQSIDALWSDQLYGDTDFDALKCAVHTYFSRANGLAFHFIDHFKTLGVSESLKYLLNAVTTSWRRGNENLDNTLPIASSDTNPIFSRWYLDQKRIPYSLWKIEIGVPEQDQQEWPALISVKPPKLESHPVEPEIVAAKPPTAAKPKIAEETKKAPSGKKPGRPAKVKVPKEIPVEPISEKPQETPLPISVEVKLAPEAELEEAAQTGNLFQLLALQD